MLIDKCRFSILFILALFLCFCEKNGSGNDDPPEFRDEKAFSGFGTQAMIAGTSGKPALEAGLQVLREGGNACDAALTKTLRKVSIQGADYIYRKDWARKFVEIVRREGGRMTIRDLEEYRPVWTEAAHTSYYGYDAYKACAWKARREAKISGLGYFSTPAGDCWAGRRPRRHMTPALRHTSLQGEHWGQKLGRLPSLVSMIKIGN
jgi:hypothetical protein